MTPRVEHCTLHIHEVCPAEPALNYTGSERQVITLYGRSFSVLLSEPCFTPPLISCTITRLDGMPTAGMIQRMNYY